MILIPVIFLLIDSAGSFIYGCVVFVHTVIELFQEHFKITTATGRFLVVMDTYLVGATLLIAAFGFYFLFIGHDTSPNTMYLPSWLRMHDLEDLKARIVSMLILVAAITFLDVIIETHDEEGAFWLGLGIAVIIAALTAYLRFGRQAHQGSGTATATTTDRHQKLPARNTSAEPDDPLDHQ